MKKAFKDFLETSPKLYQRLKLKAQRQEKFECSLDPSEVPGIKAKWSSDQKFYPFVDKYQ